MKIAIVQLGSFGDNINSTLMIAPIKAKYPDSKLTIHTASKYESAFWRCPGVDEIIKHHADTKDATFNLYNTVPALVKSMGYDLVMVPAPILHPGEWSSLKHPELGTNLILSFVRDLERHDISYELPLKTVLRLTPQEYLKAQEFCKHLPPNRRNVLMEVHAESGQTFWNANWTIEVGKHLLKKPTNLLISRAFSGHDVTALQNSCPPHSSVYCLHGHSLRECAEIFNHCEAFLSVSSGLSNACNTDHCKTDIDWIETVNSDTVNSAPIRSAKKMFVYKNDISNFIKILRTCTNL